MTKYLLGLVLSLSAVACAGNDCTRATDRTVARFEKCGVLIATETSDDTQNVTDIACTDELAADHDRTADCTERASCEALNGDDQSGADAYARCLTN